MARHALQIEQGTTWGRSWPLTNPDTGLPMDLTGWTVHGQVRETPESATVLYEWQSPGNAHTADGKVTITVAPAVSAAWLWSRGVYDIEATSPSGQVVRVSEGQVTVSREVTR